MKVLVVLTLAVFIDCYAFGQYQQPATQQYQYLPESEKPKLDLTDAFLNYLQTSKQITEDTFKLIWGSQLSQEVHHFFTHNVDLATHYTGYLQNFKNRMIPLVMDLQNQMMARAKKVQLSLAPHAEELKLKLDTYILDMNYLTSLFQSVTGVKKVY